MINTIIFDAEGVVVDTEKAWDKAQEEFLRRRGIVYEREKIKHLLSGKSQPEAIEILKTDSNLWVMLHRARMALRRCLETNWFGKDKEAE